MKTDEISNSQDIIDSRDVIARIEELEAHLESCYEDADTDAGSFDEWIEGFADTDEEVTEYKALKALAEEAEGYAADWKRGEALIRDSYFEDYARELAEDIGAIPDDAKWPCTCIDWEKAADELKMDYTQVDFAGVAYWIR